MVRYAVSVLVISVAHSVALLKLSEAEADNRWVQKNVANKNPSVRSGSSAAGLTSVQEATSSVQGKSVWFQ